VNFIKKELFSSPAKDLNKWFIDTAKQNNQYKHASNRRKDKM